MYCSRIPEKLGNVPGSRNHPEIFRYPGITRKSFVIAQSPVKHLQFRSNPEIFRDIESATNFRCFGDTRNNVFSESPGTLLGYRNLVDILRNTAVISKYSGVPESPTNMSGYRSDWECRVHIITRNSGFPEPPAKVAGHRSRPQLFRDNGDTLNYRSSESQGKHRLPTINRISVS